MCTDALRVPLSVMYKVFRHFILFRFFENNGGHGKRCLYLKREPNLEEKAHEQSAWMYEDQSAFK